MLFRYSRILVAISQSRKASPFFLFHALVFVYVLHALLLHSSLYLHTVQVVGCPCDNNCLFQFPFLISEHVSFEIDSGPMIFHKIITTLCYKEKLPNLIHSDGRSPQSAFSHLKIPNLEPKSSKKSLPAYHVAKQCEIPSSDSAVLPIAHPCFLVLQLRGQKMAQELPHGTAVPHAPRKTKPYEMSWSKI